MARKAVTLAKGASERFDLMTYEFNLGCILVHRSKCSAAIENLQKAFARIRRYVPNDRKGAAADLVQYAVQLGRVLLESGQAAEAEAVLQLLPLHGGDLLGGVAAGMMIKPNQQTCPTTAILRSSSAISLRIAVCVDVGAEEEERQAWPSLELSSRARSFSRNSGNSALTTLLISARDIFTERSAYNEASISRTGNIGGNIEEEVGLKKLRMACCILSFFDK